MLHHIPLQNMLFIDIETVSEHETINNLVGDVKEMYLTKSQRLKTEGESEEEQYTNHAAIYAEFGKIVCLSMGIFVNRKDEPLEFRIKNFSGHDEKELLTAFATVINQYYNDMRFCFTGHNIREFDIPYICRRMIINKIPLPVLLDLSGKKPYEINHVDTLHLWRFGDYKHYTSLKLLAEVLGVPSPKDDIAGKDVGRVYWQEKDLKRIADYCNKDVLTVAQLILRFKNCELLKPEQIKIAV